MSTIIVSQLLDELIAVIDTARTAAVDDSRWLNAINTGYDWLLQQEVITFDLDHHELTVPSATTEGRTYRANGSCQCTAYGLRKCVLAPCSCSPDTSSAGASRPLPPLMQWSPATDTRPATKPSPMQWNYSPKACLVETSPFYRDISTNGGNTMPEQLTTQEAEARFWARYGAYLHGQPRKPQRVEEWLSTARQLRGLQSLDTLADRLEKAATASQKPQQRRRTGQDGGYQLQRRW